MKTLNAKYLRILQNIPGGVAQEQEVGIREGYTLMEICIAMIIICVLLSISAPLYSRAVEQARLDSAAGDLKTVWSAQRAYWLKYHTFADNLEILQDEDLISRRLAETQDQPTAMYVYNIDSADAAFFVASATRNDSRVWTGKIQIDELGQLNGGIQKSDGFVLVPQVLE